jgi:hypothetical protein
VGRVVLQEQLQHIFTTQGSLRLFLVQAISLLNAGRSSTTSQPIQQLLILEIPATLVMASVYMCITPGF